MKTELLTPKQVEERLQFISTDFKEVLTIAKKQGRNVWYHSKVTPFGTYPLMVELADVAC